MGLQLHIANATLMERSNQLATIQKELDQRRTAQDNLDENYRKEKVGDISTFKLYLFYNFVGWRINTKHFPSGKTIGISSLDEKP